MIVILNKSNVLQRAARAKIRNVNNDLQKNVHKSHKVKPLYERMICENYNI